MASGLHWQIKQEAPRLELEVSGEIDENSDFSELASKLTAPADLDLQGITRINSTGVREWMTFILALADRGRSLRLTGCSVAIVQQLNMISGFVGEAAVQSIYAPYVCPECDATADRLIELSTDLSAQLEENLSCPECGSGMEFDDLVDHYFSFHRGAKAG